MVAGGARKGGRRQPDRGAPPARSGRGGTGAGRARGAAGGAGGGTPGGAPGGRRASPRASGIGGEQVEGRRAVRELLAARRRPAREVWLSEGIPDAPILDEIRDLAAAAGVPVRRVARSRLTSAARTEAPQGVLAFAAPLPEATLEELIAGAPLNRTGGLTFGGSDPGTGEGGAVLGGGGQMAAPGQPPADDPSSGGGGRSKSAKGNRRGAGAGAGRGRGPAAFLLVLDGVTDPHNLGALLRSAEGAGATGVVLPRHRAAHVTPTVAKAAAGAIEHLAFAVVPGIPAALASLAAAGVWTVGLDAGATASLWGLEVAAEPVAVVMGAEGHGLTRLARQRCDMLVSIPQRGAIGSLNVAAAGALACFEVARRRNGG